MLFSSDVWMMIAEGVQGTLYMVLVSTIFSYILGLPLAILLVVTRKNGLHPMPVVNMIADVVVNILRSVPFLILMILVTPLMRLIAGKSYGPTATIVALVIAAAPYVARMIESSLLEVDPGVIEAALSMGASHENNYSQGSDPGSKDVIDRGLYHCHRNNSWIFRHGGSPWRRRSGRYSHSLRL